MFVERLGGRRGRRRRRMIEHRRRRGNRTFRRGGKTRSFRRSVVVRIEQMPFAGLVRRRIPVRCRRLRKTRIGKIFLDSQRIRRTIESEIVKCWSRRYHRWFERRLLSRNRFTVVAGRRETADRISAKRERTVRLDVKTFRPAPATLIVSGQKNLILFLLPTGRRSFVPGVIILNQIRVV